MSETDKDYSMRLSDRILDMIADDFGTNANGVVQVDHVAVIKGIAIAIAHIAGSPDNMRTQPARRQAAKILATSLSIEIESAWSALARSGSMPT